MKIDNLYNLKSFTKFCDSHKAKGFTDAASGIVLSRQLEMIDPTIFEVKYPSLAFMNTGIEANNTGGVAEQITSLRKRGQGSFAVAGDASDNRGVITRAREKSYINVTEGSAHSKWTDTDIQRAKEANENLPADFISTANEIYQREIDETGLVGRFGTEGLLNHSSFTAAAASDTIANLLAVSAQSVYDEIAAWINAQWNAVNNIPEYMADTVVMPISIMNTISSAILNSAAGEASILTALKRNFPGVKFVSSFRAESVSSTKRAAVFSSNRQAMVMRIPQPLTVSEIIKVSGFDYRVDYKYRVAGLDVLEPAGGIIRTTL